MGENNVVRVYADEKQRLKKLRRINGETWARAYKMPFNKVGRKGYGKSKVLVELRDGPNCWYCGKEPPYRVTCDHIKPLCRGGTNHLSNLRLACWECNTQKGDKLLYVFTGGKRLPNNQ